MHQQQKSDNDWIPKSSTNKIELLNNADDLVLISDAHTKLQILNMKKYKKSKRK